MCWPFIAPPRAGEAFAVRICSRISDLLVLAIVALNGLVGSAQSAVADTGWGAAAFGLFGTSAVVWIALSLAAYRLRFQKDAITVSAWLALIVGLVCLVPSAQVAWAAGTIYFTVRIAQNRWCGRPAGAGLLISLALCARAPATWVLTTLLAEPLLEFDAVLAGLLASLATPIVGIEGNIIIHESGHRLFVMTGCSSWNNLSLALLFWFSMTNGLLADGRRVPLWHGAMISAAVVLINVVRLSMMAQTPEDYRWLHDGSGAGAVLLVTAFSVGALTYFSLRGGRHAPVAA